MTTLLKNASYLKVSHSGQTTGSLLLADLADEENAKQEKKIPVYVPEGGSITLPLDEDVLLSYQQGTIRGLEDQGYLTTTLLDQPSLVPEIWVAPDGDDENPGTREAPYASIQKAVDDLWEKFGADVVKTVRLKWGEYTEAVVLNSTEWLLTADKEVESPSGAVGQGAKWFSDGRPALTITNATKDSVESFYADNGIDYTATTTTMSYDGSDMADLEYNSEFDQFEAANVLIENITFETNGSTMASGQPIAVCVLGAKDDPGDSFGSISNVRFEKCDFGAGASGDTVFYAKNALISWSSHLANIDTSYAVFDQSIPSIERLDSQTFANQDGNYFFRMGDIGGNEYGLSVNLSAFSILNIGHVDGDVRTYFGSPFFGDPSALLEFGDIEARRDVRMNGSGGLSIEDRGTFSLRTSQDVYVNHSGESGCTYLSCRDIICDGTGSFFAKTGEVRRDVTANDGTMTFSNMVIGGDLTVNSPATVNLDNVIIKGDLLGNGTVNRSGGGVEGSVAAFTGTDNNATLS